MFKASLSEKLQRIMDLKKTRFELPSDSKEQETIFVEVENCKTDMKDGLVCATVKGKVRIFAQADKLSYGYFAKHIDAASAGDKEDLFFYDFEENAGTFLNICERSMSFVYLFEEQYDPALGEITELETSFGG